MRPIREILAEMEALESGLPRGSARLDLEFQPDARLLRELAGTDTLPFPGEPGFPDEPHPTDTLPDDVDVLREGQRDLAFRLWAVENPVPEAELLHEGDHKFIVSDDDTTPGFHEDKVTDLTSTATKLGVKWTTAESSADEERQGHVLVSEVEALVSTPAWAVLAVDKWIDVAATGTVTLDASDWSARLVAFTANSLLGDVAALRGGAITAGSSYGGFVGDNDAGQVSLWIAGGGNTMGLVVDQDDSGKLKFICSAYADQAQVLIKAFAGAQKTSADHTLSS